MSLNLEQKKAKVTELSHVVEKSISAIAADYRGLTVSEMTELRETSRNAGVVMRVYRNTLTRIAVKETDRQVSYVVRVIPYRDTRPSICCRGVVHQPASFCASVLVSESQVGRAVNKHPPAVVKKFPVTH